MAAFVGNHHKIYVAHLDLTALANRVDFGPLKRNDVDFTTFADGGFKVAKPGLASGEAMVGGFQDYDAGVLDDQISLAQIGTQYPITVVPTTSGTVTAGDPAYIARGVLNRLAPMKVTVGDAAGVELGLTYDAAFPRALVAHPSAARTTTGTGTAVALAGPTAAQKLYVALHVTAYSGLTNVVFKVQSDDGVGFASATDRITLTTVTGTGSQWGSVAGDFSTESHHRVSWTVTGTGSITFVAAFGVI